MIKIPFKISARTAKLIGRENFSNPEGAIIELVKNCYDADAKNCLVIFDILFESLPEELSIKDYNYYLKKQASLHNFYRKKGEGYCLKNEIDLDVEKQLKNFFFGFNSIYIIDNGHGMTSEIIKSHWMEIGTGNKENDYITADKRVKTGAKGIGRFALDRLGSLSEMWTVPKNNAKKSSYWKIDWEQFDVANQSLDKINAELSEQALDLSSFLALNFKGNPKILNAVKEGGFSNGTLIKISNLKDNWSFLNQDNVFKSLEALIPPKELAIPFKVIFYSLKYLKEFGEVETAFFNDYDYKLDASFNSNKAVVSLSIIRNELNLELVKTKYAYLFKKSQAPYDLKTLKEKKFNLSKTVFDLLKWEKSKENSDLLKKLGDFSFSFYYLKNTNQKDYPYKNFNSAERQKVLKKFGGIKIYRDSFRVRPYGDFGNDWLKLGERGAQSPAGAGQRIGDWRVGPNQIAGLVKISRINNSDLIDKSDRGALIENETFDILKKLIIGIINTFEIDRSIILNPFFIDAKAKEVKAREEEIKIEAEKLADKIIKERVKVENNIYGNKPDLFKESKNKQEKESYRKIIEEGFQKIEKNEELEAEIAQVRTLASLGLIVSSFAHELREVNNNVDDINDLEKIYQKIVADEIKKQQIFKDGINIIESLKVDNKRVAHWVEYSLTAIKKDKRKRASLKFETFFISLNKQWEKVLSDRNIVINFKNNVTKNCLFRAFEMDMNTIFSNLISNSIDSFNCLKKIRDREINIIVGLNRNNIEIIYSDTGIGLPKVFQKNKEEIFLPFTTSKKDKTGNDIGTGLGMYLVKNVVTDNNGLIEIIDTSIGFKIKIKFPIKNK